MTNTETVRSDIATRFARDTETHQMTIKHDEGLYRHLCFRKPDTGLYWFDLITVPGTLIFQGDGENFVFSRIDDMFQFFRNDNGRINPGYWAEKLTSGRDNIMRYAEELFASHVIEAVLEAHQEDPTLDGLAGAVHREILESDEIETEEWTLWAIRHFSFYKNEDDRHNQPPDFQFYLQDADGWLWRDYYWWFLWACHAIVWDINQYDNNKTRRESVMSKRRLLPDNLVNELNALLRCRESQGLPDRADLLNARVLELHREGWAYTELAAAMGESAHRVRLMAERADRIACERRRA